VGAFKQGDVVKQMFQKGYKISLKMYLNLCNAKVLIIDVENRVYGDRSDLEFTFSIAFFQYAIFKDSMHYNQPRIVSTQMKLTQKVDHFTVFKSFPSTSCCSQEFPSNNLENKLMLCYL